MIYYDTKRGEDGEIESAFCGRCGAQKISKESPCPVCGHREPPASAPGVGIVAVPITA